MKKTLMILLLPYLLFATTEIKEIYTCHYVIMANFTKAREREVQQVIHNLKYLPPANEYGMRKLNTQTIQADFFIRDDSKVIIEKVHFDASAIHPEDRDKKRLLKRFGIDPNESANTISLADDFSTVYFNFKGNKLESVDVKYY